MALQDEIDRAAERLDDSRGYLSGIGFEQRREALDAAREILDDPRAEHLIRYAIAGLLLGLPSDERN